MTSLETIFPFCVEVVDFDIQPNAACRGLKAKQLLIVEEIEHTCKVLVKGKHGFFTIPVKRYNGVFVVSVSLV